MIMKASIGIIGGSGFYDLASSLKEVKVETPYGCPSGKLMLGRIANQSVAFLPRHGPDHCLPPHLVNYRANIWALKSLGVKRIITSCVVGSLQKEIKPGEFVILDQFVDRTKSRVDTFFDGPIATHVSTAFPYCSQLRNLAIDSSRGLGVTIHPEGTVVVIQGPRFSTAAESTWFTKMDWQVINMTQYPEVALAREQEICYCAIAMVTDYDAGLLDSPDVKPVSTEEVVRVFNQNIVKIKKLVLKMIKNWPTKTTCECQKALANARFS
ncbi:MAG: S-methyl-5'-thioadenosine phosphorylase [Patescibacteria group bacterium]